MKGRLCTTMFLKKIISVIVEVTTELFFISFVSLFYSTCFFGTSSSPVPTLTCAIDASVICLCTCYWLNDQGTSIDHLNILFL